MWSLELAREEGWLLSEPCPLGLASTPPSTPHQTLDTNSRHLDTPCQLDQLDTPRGLVTPRHLSTHDTPSTPLDTARTTRHRLTPLISSPVACQRLSSGFLNWLLQNFITPRTGRGELSELEVERLANDSHTQSAGGKRLHNSAKAVAAQEPSDKGC